MKVEKAGGQPLNSGDKVYTGDRVTVTATRDQVSGDPTYKSGVMNFDYLQLYNDIGLIGKLNSPDGDKSYDCMFSVSSYPGSDTLKLILRGIQWTFGGTGSIDATGALVANALNDPAVGTVNVNAWDTTTIKGITTATTVHDGQTLNLNDACVIQNTGTLTVGLGAQVTFGGDMVVSNDGKLNLSGGSMILSNVNANLFIAPSGTVNLSGSILQVAKISPHTNGNGGIFHWTGGTIKCQNGTSLVESGINLTYDVGQTLPTTPTSSDGEWYTWELG